MIEISIANNMNPKRSQSVMCILCNQQWKLPAKRLVDRFCGSRLTSTFSITISLLDQSSVLFKAHIFGFVISNDISDFSSRIRFQQLCAECLMFSQEDSSSTSVSNSFDNS